MSASIIRKGQTYVHVSYLKLANKIILRLKAKLKAIAQQKP